MLYCLLWNEAIPLPPQEKNNRYRNKVLNGYLCCECCLLKSSELLVKTYQTTFPFLFAVPPWLTRITERINEKSGLFPSSVNHVLINEYLPNQGIMVCSELVQAALLISFPAYSSFFIFPHFLLLSQICVLQIYFQFCNS